MTDDLDCVMQQLFTEKAITRIHKCAREQGLPFDDFIVEATMQAVEHHEAPKIYGSARKIHWQRSCIEKPHYVTKDPTKVTCKRCLRHMSDKYEKPEPVKWPVEV